MSMLIKVIIKSLPLIFSVKLRGFIFGKEGVEYRKTTAHEKKDENKSSVTERVLI